MKKLIDSKGYTTLTIFSIITSMGVFSLGTLPDKPPEFYTWLMVAEAFIVGFFAFDLIAQVKTSDLGWGYLKTFDGIVDLLSVLPFVVIVLLTGLGTSDMFILRVLRTLSILRLLKLTRYNKALDHVKKAFWQAKDELFIVYIACMVVVVFSAVGIYLLEHDAQPDKFASVFDAFWFQIVSLTTVGYGDTYPITAGGKFFASVMALVGISLVALPAGILAGSFQKVWQEEK